jgi:AraC family ethanolamine operon transcriptional activator
MPFDAGRRAGQLKSEGRLSSYSLTFDEYGAKVREAEVIFLMTSVSRGPWEVGQSQINNIVVQYGAEGGTKIMHGVSRPDAVLFILQDTWAGQVIFDGHKADEHDFVVLPPSTHFSAATYGPNRWMSISVPTNLFWKVETPIKMNDLGWIEKEKRIVSMTPGWKKTLVDHIIDLTDSKAAVPGHNRGYGDIESYLLNLLISAISGANAIINLAENTRSSRSIMHRALEYLRHHDREALRITDIANAAKVTERSLHRAFQQQLGIGTARYLKIRKLNMVRRELWAADPPPDTLTKLLTQHGVGEFGRFASEYRAIFGENPSDTLRRSTKPAGLVRT